MDVRKDLSEKMEEYGHGLVTDKVGFKKVYKTAE